MSLTKQPRASAPLKWHGGKSYLANWIIEQMPDHVHYVEPFFGGGAVLFRKSPEGVSEVVNDINDELTNFWFVLQSTECFEQFRRIVEAIPFSQVEFDLAMRSDSNDPVVRAVSFFVRYRQSRQGLGNDFATLSRNRTRRGMNEQASSWWSAVNGLGDAHERLKRVVITQMTASNLIPQQDGRGTLFYCDPPYLHTTRTATRAYSFEMCDDDHNQLLSVLSSIDGKFLLSGYRNSLYDAVAEHFGWLRVDRQIDNKASSKKTKSIKTECLWRNFE